MRAAVANVLHRGVSQGGSTITQQLAKNLFLTQDRTLWRKMQEAVLAVWLERKFSKDEILELYLNRVYFGAGAYGVEAASQRYFGKSARQVKMAEAAMLAGLVKSPSRLAPSRNPNGAERRAQIVLAAMVEAGFVTETMAKTALVQPAHAVKTAGAGSVNYVADWIMDVLDDLVGRVEQDLVVETSIDPNLQAAAEKALVDELALKGGKFDVGQGALVAMTPDGAVRALVGGRNYNESQYQPRGRRQAPAGLGVQAVRLSHRARARADARHRARRQADRDQGLEAGELHPRLLRAGDADAGAGDVAQHGVGAAHARGRTGRGRQDRLPPRHRVEARRQCVARARHLGSLAGRAGLGLRAVRERRGRGDAARRRARAHAFRQGRSTRAPQRNLGRIVEPRYVAMMNAMMRETLTIGTAQKAQASGLAGRRQDRHVPGFPRRLVHRLYRHLVTGVWLGNDNSSPTKKATGGGLPVEIWTRFMRTAHQGVPVAALPGLVGAPSLVSAFPPWGPAPPAPVAGQRSAQAGTPASASAAGQPVRPAPIDSNSGIDGWFLDRIFGRR